MFWKKDQCSEIAVFVNKPLDLKEVVSPYQFWAKRRNNYALVDFSILRQFAKDVSNTKDFIRHM